MGPETTSTVVHVMASRQYGIVVAIGLYEADEQERLSKIVGLPYYHSYFLVLK